jgi:hypothetical protein
VAIAGLYWHDSARPVQLRLRSMITARLLPHGEVEAGD